MHFSWLLDQMLSLECQPVCEATGTTSLSARLHKGMISGWVALGLLALEELPRAELWPHAAHVEALAHLGKLSCLS